MSELSVIAQRFERELARLRESAPGLQFSGIEAAIRDLWAHERVSPAVDAAVSVAEVDAASSSAFKDDIAKPYLAPVVTSVIVGGATPVESKPDDGEPETA